MPLASLLCAWLVLTASLYGQTPPNSEAETGFPVTDKTTITKCGGCHQADKDGNLGRLSWIRTTPEGWQEAIKRMVRLNGVKLSPEEARQIVRYLATNHGLAPEESAPVAWYTEMRQIENETLPSDGVRDACAACHPLARPQSWRRSSNEWQELVNMHLGYFPVVEYTSFRRRRNPRPGGEQPKDPVETAIEHFRKAAPLHSKEWAAWRASMREPKLAGTWLVNATQPGKGKFYGRTEITAGSTAGEFTTRTRLTSLVTGQSMEFTGKVLVYTGYQWRGRSAGNGISELREVMAVSRDQSSIEGRWFWGAYQEFGFHVKLQRAANDISVLGTDLSSIRAGAAAKLRIVGQGFPTGVTAQDLDMGSGVTVKRVARISDTAVEVEVEVEANAISGPRDVVVKRSVAPAAFAVYDRIDYIKTSSDSQLARLGGRTHPKGFAQFEAIAWHRGPDGKPNTADDIPLGPVKVQWSVEEFAARHNDDDKDYVGTLDDNGLFTPAAEGPNPKRRFNADNYGDIWVVATYANPGAEPLVAKSYLVVTIPLYVRWDQPEVAQ